MAFDKDKFQKESFEVRSEKVEVPQLKVFFGDDEPVWEVRGLTGPELAKVNDASKQNKALTELVEGFVSDNIVEQVTSIKEALGLTDSVPDEIVRGISLLRFGSVNPTCSQEMAVKLANVHPVPFYMLWRKVLELTGMGQSLGESKASGQTQESE